VTKSDAPEARNTAMPANRRGAPSGRRRARQNPVMEAVDLLAARLVRSVSIQPGSTALTWILLAAQAQATGARELHDAPLLAA